VRHRAALVALLACGASASRANDSAASVGAGGIVLRSEPRVSMRKERLTIERAVDAQTASHRVTVEYEFVNETAAPVETEVAFPVPPYTHYPFELGGPVDLGEFRAWVDGAPIPVLKQVRATVDGKDHAATLKDLGIDVEHHGRFNPAEELPRPEDQIRTLDDATAARLHALGLIRGTVPAERWPLWSVAIVWHWTQRFPPGKTVRVRHEYTPSAGFQYGSDVRGFLAGIPRVCPSEPLVHDLEAWVGAKPTGTYRSIHSTWIEYILTTANSWKTPIADFELVIRKPKDEVVSFCWKGTVEQVDATTVRARARDFVPKEELTVHFLSVH
jgi:hypothetical protein